MLFKLTLLFLKGSKYRKSSQLWTQTASLLLINPPDGKCWASNETDFFSSLTYSKYTIELWPSSSLMRASRVFDLQNKNWRWNSAPTMTRESNKTGVLSCHGDSFLGHGSVSFMERIQVERECCRGVNLGKMSLSRTSSPEFSFRSPAQLR